MKSNVPWSVKGIDPEARVVAKEAARKAGMTLGEWMNTMIREVGDKPEDDTANSNLPLSSDTGVSSDQLRAVVDSLNRLNERLKTTEDNLKRSEERSRQAVVGLHQGFESTLERVKRIEQQGTAVPTGAAQPAESPDETRGRIASLKSLEQALQGMLEQFDKTRRDTIERVSKNENAVSALTERVDTIDRRLTAGFEEVYDALDFVGKHLDQTELRAKAVIEEAEAAATSSDAEFVERTGKRLQLLGNEIKRSGDQISAVEELVTALSAKIEAAEKRSAEGIAAVAKDLNGLRDDILPMFEGQSAGQGDIAAATESAENSIASLQQAYDSMLARLEGREPPAPQPSPELAAAAALAEQGPAATYQAAIGDPGTDIAPTDDTPVVADSSLAPDTDEDDDAEFDAVFSQTSTSEVSSASEPTSERLAPLVSTPPSAKPLPTDTGSLSPHDKIVAAAQARNARAQQDASTARGNVADDDDLGPLNLGAAEASAYDAAQGIDRSGGQNRKVGLPLMALIGLLFAGMVAAGLYLFGPKGPVDEGATAELETPEEAITATSDASADDGSVASVAPPRVPAVDDQALYSRAKTLLETSQSSEDQREAFALLMRAAEAGNVPAQFNLGELFFMGVGTPQDFGAARRWYGEAADGGNVAAMHRLGTLETDPTLGGADMDEAIRWFGRAASYGFVDSMYNLGLLYDPRSDYMSEDKRSAVEAYRFFSLAARSGDDQAQEDAAGVAGFLTADEIAKIDSEVAPWRPLPYDQAANDGLQALP